MRKRSDRQIRERERSGKKEKDQTDTQKRFYHYFLHDIQSDLDLPSEL